jgi:serine/threonine protein kinase
LRQNLDPAMTLRARSRLGKYRIVSRLGTGGYANVYKAYDTIEGVHVALKVPFGEAAKGEYLSAFRREIKLTAKLDHPNILPIKNADVIGGKLVVASPLGVETLDERMQRRTALATQVEFARQILDALAYAHARRIVHCDVKPDNVIVFPGNRLMLTDFGISKVGLRTVKASGSGTLGYMAPEQAMGRPSLRSDVFAAALVLYRLFTGKLPEWPFDWPPKGVERIRKGVPRGFAGILRKGMRLNAAKRYANAIEMQAAYDALLPAFEAAIQRKRRAARRPKRKPSA